MEYDVDASAKADSEADSWFAKLGPGLITGAADDDPSGIATYSQAGAQFGLNLLWTVLLTYPLMVAIQVVSARIGRVSGHGLATNLRRHYPQWLLYGTVILLLVANTINIAADLTAMGAAVNLLVGGPTRLYTVGLSVFSLVLQVFVPYGVYVRVLKWLTLRCSRTLASSSRSRFRGQPWPCARCFRTGRGTQATSRRWSPCLVRPLARICSSGRRRKRSRRCTQKKGNKH